MSTLWSRDCRARVAQERSSPSRWRAGALTLALLAALVSGLLAPAGALATDPFRVGSQLEDRVGVLRGDETAVRDALEELQDAENVQLWAVFVDTFSGLSAQEWAYETAVRSDLGLRDVLLAVAVEDRAYAYSVDEGFPLSDGELDDVMAESVEPQLADDEWADAAIGAAEGLQEALAGGGGTGSGGEPATSSGGSGFAGAILVVVLLVVVALVVWFLVRRARARRGAQEAAPGAEGTPAIPLAELRRRAGAAIVETDDALKTSAQEVGFAVAQFGEEQAAPFQQALDEAQRDLSEAFKLYKQFDDDADEARQREVLTAVLQHTDAANEKLDAQSERFDKLRDLERQAPEVFAALDRQLAELDSRVPQVEGEIAALARVYSADALKAVAANPVEAASRITFSREQVVAGREDLAAGRSGEAAVSALAAQEAAAQAQTLLDAVGRLGKDLAEAQGRIDDAIAETRRDIAEAHAAGAGAQLAALIAAAEAAVAAAGGAAGPLGGRDPLAALRHLEEADAALENALKGVRDDQARRAKATAALERTLAAARAQIAAAADFITTHRGGIGSEPRSLLAEAQRHLDQAVALSASDPVTASQHASSAHELARRALDEAQSEAGQAPWGLPGGTRLPDTGGGFGGGFGGAILGGILAEMMRGGSGRSSGGFGRSSGGGMRGGGGGFAPPSFGGSGTRMRRGGGGRF